MDELIKTSLPIIQNPVPSTFLRRGKYKTYTRQYDRLLDIPLLEHGLMQNHLIPHAHRRQTFAKMVGLDDVCTIVLCCIIGHCLTMLNG